MLPFCSQPHGNNRKTLTQSAGVLRAQINMVKAAFPSIPGARVITDGKGIDPALWAWRVGAMTRAVATAPASVASWNGDQVLAANPVSPVDGEEAIRLYELSRDACAKNVFDLLSETVAIWRSTNHRQVLPFTG